MQIKLQQAQAAKALCENMNKVLQVGSDGSRLCFRRERLKYRFVDAWPNVLPFTFMPQEDLADLKEQITLYESAVKHGVIGLDLSEEWENQLSDSCMDLGLKKSNRKNGLLHRYSITIRQWCTVERWDALIPVNSHYVTFCGHQVEL